MTKRIYRLLAGGFAFVFALAAFMSVSTVSEAVNKMAEKWGKTPLALDEGTEYHAYLVVQVKESWVCRYFPYDDEMGVENRELWDKIWTTCNRDDAEPVSGTIEDAVIKGNGRYTIKVKGLDGSLNAETAGGEPEFSILAIATDIPVDDRITFDNISVKMDGNEVATKNTDGLYYDKDFEVDPKLYCIDLINTWHAESTDKAISAMLPNDSIEISFDVSGFNYDNPDAVEATPEAEAASDDAAASTDKADSNGEEKSTGAVSTVLIIIGVVIACGAVVAVFVRRKMAS